MTATESRICIETNLAGWMWLDLDDLEGNDIYEVIAEKKHIDTESSGYLCLRGEDWIAVDVEGELARCFLGRYGCFDFAGYFAAAGYDADEEAKAAFIDFWGSWDADSFGESYCGKWDSLRDYVEETFLDCNEVPEHLENYLDWDRITYEWSMDHHEDGGHVFRCI